MNRMEQFVDSWLRHRLVVNELLEKFADKHLEFKPYEKAMSLKELVLHTIFSGVIFASALKTGKASLPDPSQLPPIDSMEGLRRLVAKVTERTKADLLELTEEKLDALVDFTALLGTHLPGEVLLTLMRDHEIHHKGQLYIYARLTGVEEKLPMFVKIEL
jgi:uncharacterized damage-inducible protein DinB